MEGPTGIAITDGIGSTEMMHIFVSAAGGDVRPGSTGKAVPGYDATVLDADGKPLDEGVGRLAIKGPTGCRYLDDPRQRDYVRTAGTSPATPTARIPTAIIWYLARSDDMIVSSGYNIGAPEVENALLSHPAVAECAVIGVPCPERGQKVKAFVVLAPTADASDDLITNSRPTRRRRSPPTNIRAKSNSSKRCQRPRPASSGAASCGRTANMWLSRIPVLLGIALWGYFAFVGFEGIAYIASQHALGYPNHAQREYYAYFPLAMAVISLVLLAVSFRAKRGAAIGCIALALLGVWFLYMIPYSGGV